LGLALLASSALVTAPLWAQTGEPIRLEYDAPATCPTQGAFLAEVRARTSRARLAEASERARTFRVSLTPTKDGTTGHLEVTEADEGTSQRVVEGASCSEVASALALVAALAIDPAASTAPIVLPPAAASETIAPTLAPTSSAPPPVQPARPPAPRSYEVASEPKTRKESRVDVAAHVALSVVTAGSPLGLVWGPSVGASLALERRSWLAPELRAGLTYAGSDSPDVANDGYATFTWWRGELEVCPLRLPLAQTLDLRPCALGRAGALVSAGHGLGSSLTSVRPWGELGASALLEWRVMGPLEFELELGADFPLLRELFDFKHPMNQVYQAPGVLAEGRLGLAVHFP
jgi:hypothetical protein